MTSSSANPEFTAWRKFLGNPFPRLVRHCVDRMFHGGDTSEADTVEFGFGALLGLLALPGVFASLFLADKYGSLFQVLRGDFDFDPYVASLPDEYFFIALAMVVTASVVVWKWDSLVPDRRDYANLAPLPIHSRRFFAANLLALLLLTAIVSLDVNAASIALFPLVVCGSRSSFSYYAVFLGAHLASVVLASAFSFLVVLASLGALISVLPFRAFQKSSLYIRCAIVTLLLAMLSTSFAVPAMVHDVSRRPWLQMLPSVWFISLNQSALGRADTVLATLGHRAVVATCMVLLLGIGAYATSYRRCFALGAESMPGPSKGDGAIVRMVFRLLDRFVFRSPFERGSIRFTFKAIARGESQALVLGWFGGLGMVIASQTLAGALNAQSSASGHIPSAAILSIPLTLAYFLILGLRCAFEVPVALRANWLFRLTVSPDTFDCAPLARKLIYLLIFPALISIALPMYAHFWGWELASIHIAIVGAMCVLFTKVVATQFRKIPFTCSMPVFKSNSIVIILIYAIGFFVFSGLTSSAEHWVFEDPLRFLVFVPWVPAVWLGLRYWQRNLTYLDKKIIFEEHSPSAVETMNLGFGA
ncbi:MAG: hypothetical protein WBY66_24970 [Candidatus Acidiferrales bacterium]